MNANEFIQLNRNADVRKLALQAKRYPDLDMPFVLNQIAGRQTAERKLPSWAAVDDIIYPPHISMEQCSSEFTARYKANITERISEDKSVFVDLTGGLGVDFSFMSHTFDKAIYVEQQGSLCQNAQHNFPLLGINNVEIMNVDGVEYLHTLSHVSVIYLDPARRNVNGGKTVAISDCTPDVISVLDELLNKADNVIIKLSPMLDWHRAMTELRHVKELHIISSDNECKELLFVLSQKTSISSQIFCINNSDIINFSLLEMGVKPRINQHFDVGMYLYEPNASIMKAGCFGLVCGRYDVEVVSENSHLFVSNDEIKNFPGRKFIINNVSTFNKTDLKHALKGIYEANITVRNFPLSVAQLRKKLKLKDGGDTYIFATTTSNNEHVLLICSKSTVA